MHVLKFVLASAFCVMAMLVQAGFRFVTGPAGAGFPAFQAAAWSPAGNRRAR